MFPLIILSLAAGPTAAASDPYLVPPTVEVETEGQLSWVWEVDADGLAAGDELRVVDPIMHGMTWAQWGGLSPFPEECTNAGEAALASIGLVRVEAYRDGRRLTDTVLGLERSNCDAESRTCDQEIHKSAVSAIYVESGDGLVEGDQVRLLLGDTEGCRDVCAADGLADCTVCDACAWEAPARAMPKLPVTAVACREDECIELAPAYLETTPHPDIDMVHVVAPSQAVVGEPWPLKIALLDTKGNAVSSGPHRVEVDLDDHALLSEDDTVFVLQEGNPGWADVEVVATAAGVYRIDVEVNGTRHRSNPVRVSETAPALSTWWGDIHVHHGLTWTDDEGNTRELNHDYARDVAGLDIVAESVKARGIELDEDALWDLMVDACSRDTVEGDFLVMLGFEWMGRMASNVLGTDDPGHHNVYYDSCEGSYGTHAPETIDSVDGDLGLWDWLRALEDATGVQAVTIPHAMVKTGYDYTVHDRELQPLAEVHSEWGDSMQWSAEAPDGTVPDMVNSGLRVGFIAASDNHDGFMGNRQARYHSVGGIGAWLAPALTRADVFAAMRARRTYATTGIRPIIDLEVIDGDATLLPGTEYIARTPVLRWSYHAHDSIQRLRVVAVDVVEDAPERTLLEEVPKGLDVSGELELTVDGLTPQAVWLEVRERGSMSAWSSPVYLSFDCQRMQDGAEDPLGLCVEPLPGDTGPTDTAPPETDGGTPDSGDGGAVDSGEPAPPEDEGCGGCGGSSAALLLLPLVAAGRRRRR